MLSASTGFSDTPTTSTSMSPQATGTTCRTDWHGRTCLQLPTWRKARAGGQAPSAIAFRRDLDRRDKEMIRAQLPRPGF